MYSFSSALTFTVVNNKAVPQMLKGSTLIYGNNNDELLFFFSLSVVVTVSVSV